MNKYLPIALAFVFSVAYDATADEKFSDISAYPFFLPEAYTHVLVEVPDVRRLDPETLEDLWYSTIGDEKTPLPIWRLLIGNYFSLQELDRTLETIELAETSLGELPIEFLWVRAVCTEAREDWAAAALAWQAITVAEPESALPALRLAFCLLQMERAQDAFNLLRRLALRMPAEPGPHHILGSLFWMQNERRLAWRSLARAATSPNTAPDTFVFLAWIAAKDHDLEESIGWLNRALAGLSPEKQIEILRIPVFRALDDHDLFQSLLAGLNLPADLSLEAAEPNIKAARTGALETHFHENISTLPGVSLGLTLRPDAGSPETVDLPASPEESGLFLRPRPASMEVKPVLSE